MPPPAFPWESLKAETLRTITKDLGAGNHSGSSKDAMIQFLQTVSKSGLASAQKAEQNTAAAANAASSKSASTVSRKAPGRPATRTRTTSLPPAPSSSSSPQRRITRTHQGQGYNTRFRGEKHPSLQGIKRTKRPPGTRGTKRTRKEKEKDDDDEQEPEPEPAEDSDQSDGEEDDNNVGEDDNASAGDARPPRTRGRTSSPTEASTSKRRAQSQSAGPSSPKRRRTSSAGPVKRGPGRPRKADAAPRKPAAKKRENVDEEGAPKPASSTPRKKPVFVGVYVPTLKRRKATAGADVSQPRASNANANAENNNNNEEHDADADADADGSVDMEADADVVNGSGSGTGTEVVPPSEPELEQTAEVHLPDHVQEHLNHASTQEGMTIDGVTTPNNGKASLVTPSTDDEDENNPFHATPAITAGGSHINTNAIDTDSNLDLNATVTLTAEESREMDTNPNPTATFTVAEGSHHQIDPNLSLEAALTALAEAEQDTASLEHEIAAIDNIVNGILNETSAENGMSMGMSGILDGDNGAGDSASAGSELDTDKDAMMIVEGREDVTVRTETEEVQRSVGGTPLDGGETVLQVQSQSQSQYLDTTITGTNDSTATTAGSNSSAQSEYLDTTIAGPNDNTATTAGSNSSSAQSHYLDTTIGGPNDSTATTAGSNSNSSSGSTIEPSQAQAQAQTQNQNQNQGTELSSMMMDMATDHYFASL